MVNPIPHGGISEESTTVDSRGRLAKEYGLDDSKVARLIRLNYLIDEWKLYVAMREYPKSDIVRFM